MTGTLLYDGACPFCRRQTARLQRWVPRSGLRCVSFRDPGVLDSFPALSFAECELEMKFVTPAGRCYGGMEAGVRVLALRTLLKPALLYYLPGLRQILDAAYRWVAARRFRISGGVCSDGVCALPGDDA